MKQRKIFSLSRRKEHNSTASNADNVRAPQAARTRCNLSAYALKYQRVRAKILARTHSDHNAYPLVRRFVRVTKSVRTITRTHTCEQNGANLSSYLDMPSGCPRHSTRTTGFGSI